VRSRKAFARMVTSHWTELKNVESLSYTQQLRDFSSYAQSNGLRFDLWLRQGAELSGPLQQAIRNGAIILRIIP
jgi:Restriction endonuclease fold toxin 7